MPADPIFALTAGAQLRGILTLERDNLKALLERHAADARALALPDTESRPQLVAMIAHREAEIAVSLAMDEQVYAMYPHLRPEHAPDE